MFNNIYIRIVAFIMFLGVFIPMDAQYVINGVVTDSVSHIPLSDINVYLKGTSAQTRTNADGVFILKTSQKRAKLVVSSVGYEKFTKTINTTSEYHFNILLIPSNITLKEIIIKPHREHYKKKGNPAVAFVERMLKHRDDHAPEKHDYWSRDRYDKMVFALNNFTEKTQKKWIYRRFPFLMDYVDTSAVTKKPILPVSMREMLGADYYRKNPASEKQLVKARKHAGVDEMFSQQGMQVLIDEVFRDVNIYEDNITLFTNKFVSPLSHLGLSFYKYYLMDTLQVEHEKCVDLAFVPFNSESFGFTGHFYVTLDSTYFIKKVVMNFPKKINLNFVDYMLLNQSFKRAEDGTRLLEGEDMVAEFKLKANSEGIYARRSVSYTNYSFNPPPDMSIYKHPESVVESLEATSRPEEYWTENRPPEPGKKTDSVERLMAQLRKNPIYYWTEKGLQVIFNGYVPSSPEKPKFYFGILNSMISHNSLEGWRYKFGGMTTANVDRHLFFKGYMAYGNMDHKVKGMGEVEYSFAPKREYANEFPIRSIKFQYQSDINQYGQYYLYTSFDNIFLTLKRQEDNRIGYMKNAEFQWRNEYASGFSFKLSARRKLQGTSILIPFNYIDNGGTIGKPVDWVKQNEMELNIRYAPHEKYYQTQWNRFPVNIDYPIFNVTHTFSQKWMGSDYNCQHTEFGVQKRFWFSAFGYTDVILKAGKVWNKVPFPLLILPNSNLSYTIQPESYSLLNAMEFINDEYASWDVTYYLNGFVFNHIPLFQKLKWREVLSTRGIYGRLSDKNNPWLSGDVFQFPVGSHVMGNTPYMEVGAGIENVFKILRFDYVWRLTYKKMPNIDTSGLRVSIHMTF